MCACIPLVQEAERLGAGGDAGAAAAAKQAEEVEEAIGNSLSSVGEAYTGVKHTQAVAALAAAPAYLVLDLTHLRGLDATGARTMGVVHRQAPGRMPRPEAGCQKFVLPAANRHAIWLASL